DPAQLLVVEALHTAHLVLGRTRFLFVCGVFLGPAVPGLRRRLRGLTSALGVGVGTGRTANEQEHEHHCDETVHTDTSRATCCGQRPREQRTSGWVGWPLGREPQTAANHSSTQQMKQTT